MQKNPAFVYLRRIEASRDIANMIVSSQNRVYLDADSLMINTLGEEVINNGPVPAATPKAASSW
ncbi:hypothetical protein EON65_41690 [archaeon]|nr:MAG: hypothetical protein EON65_41690 [archaeon]